MVVIPIRRHFDFHNDVCVQWKSVSLLHHIKQPLVGNELAWRIQFNRNHCSFFVIPSVLEPIQLDCKAFYQMGYFSTIILNEIIFFRCHVWHVENIWYKSENMDVFCKKAKLLKLSLVFIAAFSWTSYRLLHQLHSFIVKILWILSFDLAFVIVFLAVAVNETVVSDEFSLHSFNPIVVRISCTSLLFSLHRAFLLRWWHIFSESWPGLLDMHSSS